jgi:hypothetical protein
MHYFRSEWEEWFAWYPVTCNGQFIWLRKIWRRFDLVEAYGLGTATYVEYTTMEDYLASK